jgi:tetratricopeptide (TPR) repeat protein
MTPYRYPAALVRSAVAFAATAAVAFPALAADWTDYQPLPDHYQGLVAVRYRALAKQAGYEYQFRNNYGQKVTIKFVTHGKDAGSAAVSAEGSIVLEPGEQTVTGDKQRLAYRELTGAGVTEIHFSGAAPKPTLGGFYAPSVEVPALEKALTAAAKQANAADRAQSAADQAQASLRGSVGAGKGAPGASHSENDPIAGAGIGDVQAGASGAKDAAERAQKARQMAAGLERQLKEARADDAQAKAAGEARLQEALTATTAPTAAPATGKSPIMLAGDPARPALSADKMKALYQAAQDANKNKDWPGVEAALKPLLAGSGTAIKEKDRADLYYRLGTAYDNDNKPAEADAAYSEAIRLGVNDDALFNELATVQYSENKYAAAEASEQSAIKLKATDSSYFFNLGLIFSAQNKDKDAEAAYRNALHLDPNNDQIKKHLQDAVAAQKGK